MREVFIMDDSQSKTSQASFQKGAIRVDGRLTKTREQLCFEAHDPKSYYGPYQLLLSDIVKIKSCWGKGAGILPITPNGVEVTMENGEHYQFIVADNQAWINLLTHELQVTQ
ncbi:hypothetical protein [Shewanella sp. Isolate11]|uniref:hypothetical protein n=1 Tax=Shewanella sp. Isolate11 TaxID=2908530 RepID=UPI001EFDE4F3|nr:hypothetical protein [Shewanella sp. Isolate11]MCG9696777.1 hypothetical protein [Shewanella sp. Isolate11]